MFKKIIVLFVSTMILALPASAASYTEKKEDTLWKIVYNNKLTTKTIVSLNPTLKIPNNLLIGKQVNVLKEKNNVVGKQEDVSKENPTANQQVVSKEEKNTANQQVVSKEENPTANQQVNVSKENNTANKQVNVSKEEKNTANQQVVSKEENNTANEQVVSKEENNTVAQEIVSLVNKERTNAGLAPISLDAELTKVAQLKSQDMQSKNYFSHTSPTYGSPFEMMKQFGISYKSAGENIAMGQTTAKQVMEAWMNSEGHRANILDSKFTHIGVGYVEKGHYWTQMFIKK